MIIYRGKGSSRAKTDNKSPFELAEAYSRTGSVIVDASIDKTGKKTVIEIKLNDEDVLSLFNAMQLKNLARTNELQSKVSKLESKLAVKDMLFKKKSS